jgi:photosystem II stability/assembly factor-like uncharacterized protein
MGRGQRGGANEILKTYDGGSHWSKKNVGSTEELVSVCFLDANHGYVLGNNNINTNFLLRTTIAGSSWTKTIFENFNGLGTVHFPTKDRG